MPKLIKAYSLSQDCNTSYLIETQLEAARRSKETWGEQYDRIERRVVTGGIPVVWKRVEG